MSLDIVLVLFVVLWQNFRVNRQNFPGKLDRNLLRLRVQLILIPVPSAPSKEQKYREMLTISAILKRLHFHPRSTVSTRIFGMPSDVLPREVCSEPVHFRTVVSDEEYEILGRKVSCPAPASQITRLDDLNTSCSSDVDAVYDFRGRIFGQRAAGIGATSVPNGRLGTYQFDDLATDDILHKVHSLRSGILDLAKDEHLKSRAHEGRLGIIHRVALGYGGDSPSGISPGYTCIPLMKPSLPNLRLLEPE